MEKATNGLPVLEMTSWNVWEVAHNPGWTVADDGSVSLT